MRRLIASGGGGSAVVIPPPDGEVTPTPIPPYTIPAASPYNVGTVAVTPTSDGTGEAMHPDVYDAGPAGWNGKRYWLATTAFDQALNQNENPHVLCSNNGWVFTEPAPGVNPIDPWPGQATSDTQWYNSDTDIHHDPDTNELVVTWREVKVSAGTETIFLSASTNGVDWSAPVAIHAFTGSVNYDNVSQSLIKVSPTEWRLYFYQVARYFTATSRLGPYTSPQTVTFTGAVTQAGYHGDVIKHGNRYYALFQLGGQEYPGTSIDGKTFTMGAPVLSDGTYSGLTQSMYRSSMQIDPLNPSVVGVWYGCHDNNHGGGVNQLNSAYTRIPLSRWPAL